MSIISVRTISAIIANVSMLSAAACTIGLKVHAIMYAAEDDGVILFQLEP